MNEFPGKELATPLNTYTSCIDCHQKQGEHWSKTSHSLAFATLIRNNEEFNTKCYQCHSLGFEKANGFSRFKDIIAFDSKDVPKKKNYHKELKEILKSLKEVRKSGSKDRKKTHQAWTKLDEKFQVSHNFANVQCLNCHKTHTDHPFDRQAKQHHPIKDRCLSCHTPDQSPKWYGKNSLRPNPAVFLDLYKHIACPLGATN